MAKRMAKRAARRRAPGARKAARRRVEPIPAGYHTVTSYLTVNDGPGALAFYRRAFGARETVRMPGPDGRLMHGEMRIGNSIVMLSDEMPGSKCQAPTSLGGTTTMQFLYVPNVDAAFKRAVDAGCETVQPLTDMFWGDRYGMVRDLFGNVWGLATHKEDVSPAELKKRMAQMGRPA